MSTLLRWSPIHTSLVTLGLAAGAIAPWLQPAQAQVFPDIQNHWARPFIESLTSQNILAGYPDGTFRPEQNMQRDEFAAVVRRAFDQQTTRQIESGSVFTDVPQGYWADQAIKEAYEMGFVNAQNGYFRPNEAVTRASALATLVNTLDLSAQQTAQGSDSVAAPTDPAQAAAPQTTPTQTTVAPVAQPAPAPANSPRQRRNARRQPTLPLAFAALLQPFVNSRTVQAAQTAVSAPAPAAPIPAAPIPAAGAAAPTNPVTPAPDPVAAQPAAPEPGAASETALLNQYYDDAADIPSQATGAIASATRSNLVVNYPTRTVLEPNRPATRGEVAAFVHQALVNQGRLEPLPNEAAASQYIVSPDR